VSWGTIIPGAGKVLPGDTNFGTPNAPTIKNTGNSGLQLGLVMEALVQQGVQGPKQIVDFDAAFGKSASVLEWIDPIDAGVLVWFSGDNINQVLCANEVGKLDLSVHPPPALPNGDYRGQVVIYAQLAPGICPGEELVADPD
jgi:hypothetical protein